MATEPGATHCDGASPRRGAGWFRGLGPLPQPGSERAMRHSLNAFRRTGCNAAWAPRPSLRRRLAHRASRRAPCEGEGQGRAHRETACAGAGGESLRETVHRRKTCFCAENGLSGGGATGGDPTAKQDSTTKQAGRTQTSPRRMARAARANGREQPAGGVGPKRCRNQRGQAAPARRHFLPGMSRHWAPGRPSPGRNARAG